MLIPTDQRRKIHEYLFNEGVLVANKNFETIHPDLQLKNLYVIKALQSLNSKGFVKTQFSWQYYYYTLTDEGVEYLRQWLYLPDFVTPVTHQRERPAEAPGTHGKAVDAQATLA